MTMHARTDTDSPSHFDVGASRQAAARHRTAIQHEITHLFDDLAPLAVPGRRAPIAAPVATHRWPNRCIQQGPTHAVSLTWFVGSRDDESLGELLVMTWRGRVTLPGSGARATEIRELISLCQETVKRELGHELQPEIGFIGEF